MDCAPEPAEYLALVPLEAIVIGEQQVRHDPYDDAIAELAADIAHRGLLQPVGVWEPVDGRYQLRFGSRRVAAHARLAWPWILAVVKRGVAHDIRATALVENLHRRQLTLEEECSGVASLHRDEGLSPGQIADRLSRPRQWVLTRLAIPNFPADVRDPLLDGALSLGAAEAIAGLDDAGARAYIIGQTVAARLSVPQVRELCRAWQATPSIGEAVDAGLEAMQSRPNVPVLLTPCAACQRPRPPEQLILVRICAAGCSPPAPVMPGVTPAQPNGSDAD